MIGSPRINVLRLKIHTIISIDLFNYNNIKYE